jgi:hypothetical protein
MVRSLSVVMEETRMLPQIKEVAGAVQVGLAVEEVVWVVGAEVDPAMAIQPSSCLAAFLQ